MSRLVVRDLRASVDGHEILHGIDLAVASGEVHAVMGPNGSGKSTLSHVLMGRGDYSVTSGSVSIDDVELIGLPTWRRARAGLFLAMQYPVEVPGVNVFDLLGAAGLERDPNELEGAVRTEAERLGVRGELLARGVNDEFSGGERKRSETVQLAVAGPRFAVLDEIDSGLDVDALRDVSRRVAELADEGDLGVLAITHYARLLDELPADRVHIMMGGRIVASGGPELADRVEEHGYEGLASELGVEELTVEAPREADPFVDPTIGDNPLTGPDIDPFA